MEKTINIFGDITSFPRAQNEVSADMIMKEVQGLSKPDKLFININSYGGEVFEAIAIASILSSCPASKIFNVIGICASAATMLFSSTDTVNIAKGAMLMYHKPIVDISGNALQLRKTAKTLDKIERENIILGLQVRSGKTPEEITALITDEWWLSSDEAVQILGFVDAGVNAIENKATTKNTDIYKNYIDKKKALSVNAYSIFINHKNSLK
jgi:ATP-dependent protease ClpP protease subunit